MPDHMASGRPLEPRRPSREGGIVIDQS